MVLMQHSVSAPSAHQFRNKLVQPSLSLGSTCVKSKHTTMRSTHQTWWYFSAKPEQSRVMGWVFMSIWGGAVKGLPDILMSMGVQLTLASLNH